MAKIVRFLLLFLLAASLHGANYVQIFNQFDTKFSTSSKMQKQNLHNELKNLYLKTSEKKDKNEKINLLYRLIYSSKELGYGAQSYEKELARLGGKYSNYSAKITKNDPSILKKTIPKSESQATGKAAQKEVNEKKSSTKTVEIEKTQTKKTETKKAEAKTATKATKLPAKTDKTVQLKLLSVYKKNGNLELKFNQEVASDDVKKFALSSKDSYRNVLDFKALKTNKVDKLSNYMVDEIRIAQFSKDTTRVVFTHMAKFEIDFVQNGDLITIKTRGVSDKTTKTTDKIKSTTKVDEVHNQAKNKLVVIDAGHGGSDPGALGNSLKEKEIVLSVAKMTGEILKKRGYNIQYTRTTDKFINLKSRTAVANKKNADMFISIHANAAPNKNAAKTMSGVETFFLSPARSQRSKNVAALENKGDIEDMNHFSQQTFLNFLNREKIIASNKLAIDIQKYMLSSLKKSYTVKDGGVREAPFWVLVGAQMPAVLIEIGYITHKTEGKNLGKSGYQKKLAEGIAGGVDAYFIKNQ